MAQESLPEEGENEPSTFNKVQPESPSGFVPPSIDELQELIPAYEFIEFIDRGGMGAVYKAKQPQLDRTVAVKLLPPDFGRELSFEKRFRREAKTMAQLSHPNIVSVFDFGETKEGHLYIVMEFIEGSDLRRIIRSQSLKASQVLPIINQICDALQYAHDHGIIHRDIKPANILINKEGHVKVGDFGLAKPFITDPDLSQVSSPGVSAGTPAYMAPEAMEDNEIDHRADIYSLGVVIYEMLTGILPKGAFDPPSKCAGADLKFDEIVNRAMQSDREARFQQAADISHVFDSELSEGSQETTPRRSHKAKVAFAIVSLALIGVLAFVWSKNQFGIVSADALSTVEFERASRDLAHWVFKRDGFVEVRSIDGNVTSSANLPKGVFEIWRISFEKQEAFNDADLKELVDQCYLLPAITNLNLQGTAITPLGAAELPRLADRLRALNLANTMAVSDDSIQLLGSLDQMDLLILSVGEQPASSGFPPMTDSGSKQLSQLLPDCKINWRTNKSLNQGLPDDARRELKHLTR